MLLFVQRAEEVGWRGGRQSAHVSAEWEEKEFGLNT